MNDVATTKDAEQAIHGLGNQALMDAVVRQRDVALSNQAQAEAKAAVLEVANRGLQGELERVNAELAKATANRAQRRAAR